MKISMIAALLLVVGLLLGVGAAELALPARHTMPDNPPKGESIRLYSTSARGYVMAEKIVKSEEEWEKVLTPEQFDVTRRKGTERAFTGVYWDNHEKGTYRCVCCGTDLFNSDTKFESGTGWPSFWRPIARENVIEDVDNSLFMKRTEVLCSRCGAHLGHVFDDGPKPTGLRYCMNSAALKFEKSK